MILPRGITGFDVSRGQPTPDSKGFLADCWGVALALRGRIDDRPQVLAGSLTNFVAHVVVLPDGIGMDTTFGLGEFASKVVGLAGAE